MGKHLPYTIKVELVRGCSRKCAFCGINTMPWKDESYKFMEFETFENICSDLAEWRPKVRMEFAERGEMTFHPDLLYFIEHMRTTLPKVQLTITSNGDMLNKVFNFVEWTNSLLDAGLNIMMYDCYTSKRYAMFKDMFPDAKLFYEDDWHPYRYMGPKTREVLLVHDNKKNHKIRRWHNAAGAVDITKATKAGYDINTIAEPLESMCVRPFREMEIHYDGTVTLCCNDWCEDCVIGNVDHDYLEILWDAMDSHRKILLEKRRKDISPCDVCSERAGMRVGLEMGWFK